jgi:single-strand DNA-binding protein
MARGTLNRVILIGRLGQDPEVRYLPSGTPVASFTLATNEVWKKDGEKKESTDWHNIVAFGFRADYVKDYIEKGQKVLIEGRIKYETWQDETGTTRHSTKIVADQIQGLGYSGGNGQNEEVETEQEYDEDDSVPF